PLPHHIMPHAPLQGPPTPAQHQKKEERTAPPPYHVPRSPATKGAPKDHQSTFPSLRLTPCLLSLPRILPQQAREVV
ncbi:hypothetical protein T484DRAFT_1643709, partial [Baffinella frigidus]